MKRLSVRSYCLLVIVFFLGFSFLHVTVNQMHQYYQQRLTLDKKVALLKRVTRSVNKRGSINRNLVLFMAKRLVYIRQTSRPLPNALKLSLANHIDFKTILAPMPKEKFISLAIPGGQWVNIDFSNRHPSGHILMIYFVLCVAIVLIVLLLIGFIIGQLSRPMKQLNQLSHDLQAHSSSNKFVISSISGAEEITQSINALQNQISTLLSDRTQMLAAISHDLRTPITRLKLRLEDLEDLKLSSKITKDLEDMEYMINSVLSFIQSDYEEAPVTFDLSALIDTLVNDMQDAGFSVHNDSTESQLHFTGQMQAIKRALSNVLDNAIKYGDGAVICAKRNNASFIVTIDDHGPGIPESELVKVFKPFYRLDLTRNNKTQGTGLGLVIVKDILEKNRASIELINLPKGGLRVQVTFLFA